MEWSDEGIVLSARKHGENAVVVMLLTRSHGRHAGLARGGAGARARGLYQAGNRVTAVWRARLSEHLGSYRCELIGARAAAVLDDPVRLAILAAATAVSATALPEREPHLAAHDALARLLDTLAATGTEAAAAYVRWELALLTDLGFGLDLRACAATGGTVDLAYVSPRSGRAVSRQAAEPYLGRMLRLPAFLADSAAAPGPGEIAAGLALTGYFLERHVFTAQGAERHAMPAARRRVVERLAAMGGA